MAFCKTDPEILLLPSSPHCGFHTEAQRCTKEELAGNHVISPTAPSGTTDTKLLFHKQYHVPGVVQNKLSSQRSLSYEVLLLLLPFWN